MRVNTLTQNRSRGKRRRRDETVVNRRQYSLFDAVPVAPAADARHFRRQAELCQRLLGALYQPELVEMLGRLHEEYEATATRIEATGGGLATGR
jgi:hypothetical protein